MPRVKSCLFNNFTININGTSGVSVIESDPVPLSCSAQAKATPELGSGPYMCVVSFIVKLNT